MSNALSTTGRGRPVGRALITTGALLGAGLAFAPAPSYAAEPAAPALTWEISKNFDEGFSLSNHTLGDGATEAADGVITFPNGVGSYDAATGATAMSYQGSVTATFNNPGTGALLYSITFEDPAVEVSASGDGVLTAVVTSTVAGSGDVPNDVTTPTRVDMTSFATEGATPGASYVELTETPAWDGVLAADSAEALALAIPAGKPVAGQAFDPELLGQLQSSLRSHFYASGSASDANKAPAQFTAETSELAPIVNAAVTDASFAGGLDVLAAGANFRAVTEPGDAGVYVGIAEAGDFPDTSSMEDNEFLTADYITPGRMPEGTWVSSLNVPTAKLDPAKDYAVFTWQAHTHSNPSQDTQTPLAIDWSQLEPVAPVVPKASKVIAKTAKVPTTTKSGKVSIRVAAPGTTPTGKVTLKLKKGVATKKSAAKTLKGGRASWTLPKLPAGTYKVVVRYAGSATVKASSDVVKFSVKR